MRTTGRIDAFVRQHEAFYRPAIHDVGIDDLLDVSGRDPSIPDTFGINHHGGTVFALIETPRHIGAHPFLESAESEFLLEKKLQLGLARGIATTTRMSWLALIAADEQVPFKLGHNFNVQEFAAWERQGAPGLARA